tara:strand:- start:847 stop:1611 length:765 start_codon:yes stop_codon:yes gene_type:complete
MRSPLKSQNESAICVNEINKLISLPSKINSFVFFTGDLEFRLAEYGHLVNAHTINPYVYEFWEHVMMDPQRLYEIVTSRHFKFDGPEAFYQLQKSWAQEKGITRAAMFYVLNRCSDVGHISKGSLELEGFNYFSHRYLRELKFPPNFQLILDDDLSLEAQIDASDPDAYVLAHIGKFGYNLFEHGKLRGAEDTMINHRTLRDMMKTQDRRCLMIYKYHPHIEKFFTHFNLIFVDVHGIPANASENCEEIIVTNF